MDSFMPEDTAMTASAYSMEFFSDQEEISYPPPSWSRFQGRCGSKECAVTTWGISYGRAARWPPKPEYQAGECATSMLRAACAMRSPVDEVCKAGLASTGAGSTPRP